MGFLCSPYLCCFNLLFDDGWVNPRTLQIMNNILSVTDGGQKGSHVIPELLCQLQNVKEFALPFLSPSFDVFPEKYHLIQLILDF